MAGRRLRLIFLLPLLHPVLAHARSLERFPVDTIEWLAARADVVVAGTIEEVRTDPSPWHKVVLRVTRTFKGEAGPTLKFRRLARDLSGTPRPWRDVGEQLFFLLRGVDIAREHWRDPAAWEWLTLNADGPVPIPLGDLKSRPLISCTFELLTDLDAVAAAIRSAPPLLHPVQARLVKPPDASPARIRFHGHAGAILRVPSDDRWKLPYLRYLTMRVPVAWNDYPYPEELKTPETVAFVTSLLDHPAWRRAQIKGWNRSLPNFEMRRYTVRHGARRLLAMWDVPPARRVTVEEPLLARRPIPKEFAFLALAAVPALVFPRRTPLPRRLLNLFTVLSCLAAAAVVTFALRSRTHYDDALFATSASQYEISSFHGRLQYLTVADEPAPYPALFGSTTGDSNAIPDHIGYLNPTSRTTRFGVEQITGLTPPTADGPTTTYPYRLTRINYQALLIPPLLLPAARLLAFLNRRLRARRRRARNLCPACAYDLRASPDRCPECGHRPTA
jgi:hypothetical protein